MAHVLLVEDDQQNYEMLTRRLQRRGYDVTLATDGKRAVERARVTKPDLILMDIRLPEQDGYEATRAIRRFEDGGAAETPVIALTAHALEEDREKAFTAGCDDYHAKPVHFSKLVEQMEALLDDVPEA
ncbi:MAG: two-component system response regulator [Bacteroidetes bacterium QS_9_68_14]|nr:MAG: two-component system response regulator [Bacteroidetes bacterium QS_9_68_14]